MMRAQKGGREEGEETKLGFNSSRQIVQQEGDEEVARGEGKIRRFRHGILSENISKSCLLKG